MSLSSISAYTLLSGAVAESMDKSTPLSERLVLGLQTLVLGLGIVMIILAFLWGVLELFRVIFYEIPNKRKKPEIINPDNEETEPEETVQQSDDGELIAVITAAAAAYLDDEAKRTGKEAPGFRVVSFKKLNGGHNK